ncbi:glycosyltransferase [Microcystis elabens FACHB-917]|nr:glycosyltransferase [Microcystis elabens FACHB-917]
MEALEVCLESIAGQTHHDWEVIVVDAQSPLSADVKTLVSTFSQTRYLSDTNGNGVYPAMNLGLAQSRGAWILFLGHDDCLCDPTVFERVKAHIGMRRCCFWRQAYYGDVLIQGDAGWAMDGDVYAGRFNLSSLLRRNICHQAIFYRGRNARENRYGYSDAHPITADWDYNIRAWTCGGFGYFPILVSVFRGGGASAAMQYDGFTGLRTLSWRYWREKRPRVLAFITLIYCWLAARLCRSAR